MAARTNQVIISSELRGQLGWGYLNAAMTPGICLQLIDAFYQSNQHRWRKWNYATGERGLICVLLEDELRGRDLTIEWVSGSLARIYVPSAGEELNMLKSDESGTGDDVVETSRLIVEQGTGGLLLTTGSPESEPFMSIGALTDPTASEHIPCIYTGY